MELIRIVNRGICGTVERLLPLSLLLMMLSLGMSGLSSASVAEANVTPSASLETETGQSASSEWDVAAPDYTVDALPARISTSTGTWMSLDVSPDGRQVVFDLLGDIYLLPINGGEAVPIIEGISWDIQPRFSPDGGSIAFTSDRDGGDNIWTMDLATETFRQVSFESFRLLNNPVWHPSGSYIAARKHFTTSRSLGAGEIWTYHVKAEDGAMGAPLVKRPSPNYQKELGEPAYGSQGDLLYYTQSATPGDTFIYHEDSNGALFAIKRLNLTDGSTDVVAGGAGGAVRATPSPDGVWLAYVKRVRAASRLFIKNLQSQEEIMLVSDLDPDMQETWGVYGLYPNMAWTPDSRSLVYWAKGRIWRVDTASGEVTLIPFKVNNERAIFPAPDVQVAVAPDQFTTKMVRFASASPSGDRIVFESLGQLWLKHRDKPPRPLTRDKLAGHDYAPVWSSDGKKIYFVRWQDDQLGSIRVVSSNRGKSRQVSNHPGHYVDLQISVDDQALVYRRLSGSNMTHPGWGDKPGLYQLLLASSEETRISKKGTHPHYGADGRIYALERTWAAAGRGSDSSAQSKLISVNSAGFDARTHASSEFATDFRISPDGRYLAFIEHFQLYLTVMPAQGLTFQVGPSSTAMPVKQVSQWGADYVSFSKDGKTLNWSIGPDYKSIQVESFLFDDEAKTTAVNLSQSIDAAKPAGVIALVGGKVITMDANRSVLEAGVVLIQENRIQQVGTRSEVSIPADAKVLDVTGKTVMPGMIDAHAHGPYARDQIIPQQNWSLLAHLALGVTTVHNPSSRSRQVFAAAEYQKSGRILGPRIFSTGEIVYGAKSTGFAPVDSLDDALAHVKRLKSQGAVSIKNYNHPRRSQRQQVIEAARREGMLVVAEGASLFHQDMNLIVDGSTGVEHNIPTLNIYDDVIQFWQQSSTGYTPTLVVAYGGLTSEDYYYQDTEVWKHDLLANFVPPTVLQARSVRRIMAPEADFRDDDAAAVAKLLLEAGVTVNTGAHGQREGLATHWELWSFVRGGMSPMQALSLATVNPANYLGMADELGSVEPGKLADLLVLDADPLDNIRNSDRIVWVVINGRIFAADSLNETLTGEAKLKPLWWHGKPQHEIR
ncbi:MAG: amidohydrolase family protein [Gammaproteobacteria bacterium]|nr:amidohydrolase family protein [Gammaproteobacteria bacterium]